MGADMNGIHGTVYGKPIVSLRVCWDTSLNSTGSSASQWESFFMWLNVQCRIMPLKNVLQHLFNLQAAADKVKDDIVLTLLSIWAPPIIPGCY